MAPAFFVADQTLFSIWLVMYGIVLDAFTTVPIPLGTSVTTPPAFLLLLVPVFVAHALLAKCWMGFCAATRFFAHYIALFSLVHSFVG